MKTIYLVRHGKAESREIDKPDYERTLIERGINDSLQVAKHLKKDKIKPSLIVSSPVPRAFETARLFAQTFGYKVKRIKQRKAMYDQADGVLLDIVASLDDDCDSVMLVGHNPSMDDFAKFLTPDFHETLPTCGVAGITVNVKSWKDVTGGCGKLELFAFPQPEKASKKEVKKDLEAKITRQIEAVLREADAQAAAKMKKAVKKAAGGLVERFLKESGG